MSGLSRRGAKAVEMAMVAVLGTAGLFLGHALEYLALFPDHLHRGEVLADTGHHYLSPATTVVAFLALLAVAVVVLSGFRRGARSVADDDHGPLGAVRGAWARVVPLAQALAFAALEMGERVAAQAPLSDLGAVLVLGVPLQVVLGLVATALLARLARAGERLGRVVASRTTRPRPRPTSVPWSPVPEATGPCSATRRCTPARAPPSLLAVAV